MIGKMDVIRRGPKPLTLLLSVTLLASACAHDGQPTAIALGDSTISGEGAEAFITGDGARNYMGDVPNPLFATGNHAEPYFCHVSRNSSIMVANLPGVEVRKNLSCSGADPEDLIRANPDRVRTEAGTQTALVKPQLDQFWEETAESDVKLVLVSMGANNSINNFSGVLGFCHAIFMADAAGGPAGSVAVKTVTDVFNGSGTSVFPSVENALNNHGCTAVDFYTQAQLNTITDAYEEGLARLIAGMALKGYKGNEWKLVVQGYASPFPPVPHSSFLSESGKTDNNGGRFADLARKRYAAGCPVHATTMRVSGEMANILSSISKDVVARIRNRYPNQDIVYLDVQKAFDGARLCEQENSPAGALWNPIWFRDETNTINREIPTPAATTLAGQWAKLATACTDNTTGVFARCQDAAHPNVNGHAALGRCLSLAVDHSNGTDGSSDVECRRDPANGSVSVRSL